MSDLEGAAAGPRPGDLRSGDPRPVDSQSAGAQSVGPDPAGAQPVGSEPVSARSVGSEPGSAQPASGLTPLFNASFDGDTLSNLRHRVATCAAAAGLLARSLQSFVLAVNELTTNAVLHGGGRGRLRLWRTGSALVCEVSDSGPGLPPERRGAQWLPPSAASGGRGLWLAHRLFPGTTVSTGSGGTTIRLTVGLPATGGTS